MDDTASDDPFDPLPPHLAPAIEARVVALVMLGGIIGAVARYQAGLWWPTRTGCFPWTTLAVNVLGCALIGVLIVLVTEVVPHRRLLRPLLGTGVLGGFTTFSSYAVDIQRLIAEHRPGLAGLDLAATIVAALAAVVLATRATRLTVAAVRR